jgi:GxxExxY protein
MPIHVGAEIRPMADAEFKVRVYDVMRHVSDMHRKLGRLFQEKIYQRAIAYRIPDAEREVPVELRFDGFCKTYYLDLLVGGGAIFELKAAESLSGRHERQLMHYLFLTGLPHGKLVNLRPERVEHKFVNNTLTPAERAAFVVAAEGWRETGAARLKEGMIGLLRDWGVGLDVALYEEAAGNLCGQPPDAQCQVGIRLGGRPLGAQAMRLAGPGVGLRITALPAQREREYQIHLSRLLDHADLEAIQWINITRPVVRFRTVEKGG